MPLADVWKKSADRNVWQACLLWTSTTNFPTFDAFYFYTEVYAAQMTVSSDQPLKNGGAYQVSQYFSPINSAKAQYPAVFVAPPSVITGSQKQC